ncbi:hypothetical protein BDQ17DRAFT_1246240, partial [Cyathus striatus]
MVVVQDPKHARKTMHNNLFSGAQFLILGKHPVYYEQVRKIAFDIECTPLYNRDVKKLDHQDDCAAARLFSADTLAYIIYHSPESIGLFVYLYVFGEMIDGYESRTASHFEQMKSILRGYFFKSIWKKCLE